MIVQWDSDKIAKARIADSGILPLMEWFQKNARVLPWRENPVPYKVWVSEIMLQQTRVDTVKPYYERFLKQLPDVWALASCPEDELLKLWEGLGYYSRVRNMQKAALIVCREYGGHLPSQREKLMELPGIGSYTAGAIASIACGKPEPAVDGNLLRVLSRMTGSRDCIDEISVRRDWEDICREVLVKNSGQADPGQVNQALMDIGATVCLPNGEPACGRCPFTGICRAEAEGTALQIPVRKAARARRIEARTILLIRDSRSVLIRRRPESGLLAGMWEFPGLEGHAGLRQVEAYTESLGLKPMGFRMLPEAKHVFSHVEWHMTGWMVSVRSLGEADLRDAFRSASAEEIAGKYAVPAAFASYKKFICQQAQAAGEKEEIGD